MIETFDATVLQWFQGIHMDWLTPIMKFVTDIGEYGLIWIVVAIILIITKKYRKLGIFLGAALLLGLMDGNGILKNVVQRPRPCWRDPSLLLIASPKDFSFPSGHTLAGFEAVTILMYGNRKFGIPALVLAVTIACSRMYLYVHYPTDILAGMVLGIFNAVLVIMGGNYLMKKYQERKGGSLCIKK